MLKIILNCTAVFLLSCTALMGSTEKSMAGNPPPKFHIATPPLQHRDPEFRGGPTNPGTGNFANALGLPTVNALSSVQGFHKEPATPYHDPIPPNFKNGVLVGP